MKNTIRLERKDKYKRTAFSMACERNNLNIVEVLADKVDIEYKDKLGRSGFYVACRDNYPKLAKYLIEKNVNIETEDY